MGGSEYSCDRCVSQYDFHIGYLNSCAKVLTDILPIKYFTRIARKVMLVVVEILKNQFILTQMIFYLFWRVIEKKFGNMKTVPANFHCTIPKCLTRLNGPLERNCRIVAKIALNFPLIYIRFRIFCLWYSLPPHFLHLPYHNLF